jgi:hypothetical protein
MKLLSVMTITGVGLILLISSGLAIGKTYTPNVKSSTQPLLTLTKVKTFKSKTVFEFSYQVTGGDKKIGIYPPGHDLAFFVTDIKKSKKYHLRDAKKIAYIPNETKLTEDQTYTFSLTFPKLPKLKTFHLIEGNQKLVDGLAWHFSNIKLK